MTELVPTDSNPTAGQPPGTGGLDPSTEIDPEAENLCPGCLHTVEYDQLLCGHCGSPQDFLSATIPYISVLAEGYVYQKAITSPQHWLSVAGIWMIFGTFVLFGCFTLTEVWSSRAFFDRLELTCQAALGIGFVTVGLRGVLCSTRNFRRWCRERKQISVEETISQD